MKKLLIIFSIALGFISCGGNHKKMTQADFERLFTHDSIDRISLYTNKAEAEIRLKPAGEGNEIYVLPIESAASFQASFGELRESLHARNIHPTYLLTEDSGAEWPFYIPLFGLAFSLASFILFLLAAIDILKSKFETATDKLTWFLAVLFVPVIGPVLYLFIGRKQKVAKE